MGGERSGPTALSQPRDAAGTGHWGQCRPKGDVADDWAPSAGIEPAAYRLGGGRSIRPSYEGKRGALCGALLATTIVPLSRIPVGFVRPVGIRPRRFGPPEGCAITQPKSSNRQEVALPDEPPGFRVAALV